MKHMENGPAFNSLIFLIILLFFFSCLAVTAKEKPPINVVGDVGGRIAIVVVSIQSCLQWKAAES